MSDPPAAGRVASVDALRGLVMIIMALDHTRDYFHAGAMLFQPEDLTRTTVALFFTRWITHICAPVFMFTAGLGAFYWLKRGRTTAQLSRFLWTRGLWLVVLELTALRFIMSFGLREGPVLLTILWALGCSMIGLGFLVWLPARVLAVVSVVVIALHNLTDRISGAQVFGESAAWLWNVLHQPGVIHAPDPLVIVAYPLVPWVFVMAAGFCFGQVMMMDTAQRQRWLIRIGVAMTVAFIVIRAINVYGDPFRWSNEIPGMTVLSFLRTVKYPPSLLFLLMTLGPAMLLLAWFDRARFSKTNPLIVFGRVPMFYFLAHFTMVHLLAIPFALAKYGRAGFLWHPMPSVGGSAEFYPAGFGYSLGVVWAVWIFVVVAMYPLCLWFMRVKQRRTDWWLSYL